MTSHINHLYIKLRIGLESPKNHRFAGVLIQWRNSFSVIKVSSQHSTSGAVQGGNKKGLISVQVYAIDLSNRMACKRFMFYIPYV